MTIWTYLTGSTSTDYTVSTIDDTNPGTSLGQTRTVVEGNPGLPNTVGTKRWARRTFLGGGVTRLEPTTWVARYPTSATPTTPVSQIPGSTTTVNVAQHAAGAYEDMTMWVRIGSDRFGDPIMGYVLMDAQAFPPPPPAPVASDLGERVAQMLTGRFDDPDLVRLCRSTGETITHLARNFTRGRGFVAGLPNKDIEAVIVSATARLAANPEQIESQVGTAIVRGGFNGWSPLERIVLGSYRGQAG